ncbi:MAG: hypothetical protein ABEK59_11070 [Halobacteria archaeon]
MSVDEQVDGETHMGIGEEKSPEGWLRYASKVRFGHVTLVLALVASVLAYLQTADGVNRASATLAVFIWTVAATWISVEFYKGNLVREKEELKKWNEDWRATVIDFRNENEELSQENEELRETIKDLSRENYELKNHLDEETEALEEKVNTPEADKK